MSEPIAVKGFVLLNPDGTNRTGKFMKTDESVVMTEKAEQRAVERILRCKKVYRLELKLSRADGVYRANIYFDPEAADKRSPANYRIDAMIRDMHDPKKAPYPELPVQLFGPVILVPVDEPTPASSVLIA